MEQFDFVVIGAGPAGEAAAFLALERGQDRGGGRAGPLRRRVPLLGVHALQDAAPRRGRARRRRHVSVEPGVGAAGLHDQPRTAPPDTRRRRPRPRPREGRGHRDPGRRAADGQGRRVRRGARRRPADPQRPRRRPRRGLHHPHAGDRGPGRHGPVDERGADRDPGAAAQPADPGRRPDRGGARPGLRPLRRAGHDRRVQPPAAGPRPSAQFGGRPGRPGTGRRQGAHRCARGQGRAGRRGGRGPSHRAWRRHLGRGPSDPHRHRAGVPPGRPAPRRRRASTRAPSSPTAGCASPTACGWSAIRRAPSCTPT